MKMCHVCYYNNSDATFRLLMSGDINPNPGPVSASTAGKINCLVMNARSVKSYHKDSTTNWQSVCHLHRFLDLVYTENSDVICVNETWLNQNTIYGSNPGHLLHISHPYSLDQRRLAGNFDLFQRVSHDNK